MAKAKRLVWMHRQSSISAFHSCLKTLYGLIGLSFLEHGFHHENICSDIHLFHYRKINTPEDLLPYFKRRQLLQRRIYQYLNPCKNGSCSWKNKFATRGCKAINIFMLELFPWKHILKTWGKYLFVYSAGLGPLMNLFNLALLWCPFGWWQLKPFSVTLTLVLLNLDVSCLCKQCKSRSVGFLEANWSGSALFVIQYVSLSTIQIK